MTNRGSRSVWFSSALGLSLLGLSVGAAPPSSSLAGRWEGAFVRLNSVQLVTLDLVERDGRLEGIETIPELFVRRPVTIVANDADRLVIKFTYGQFALRLSGDGYELTGENPKWGPPVALHLKRSLRVEPAPWTEIVHFSSGGVRLRGLIATSGPSGVRRPGVVIVAGSGAQGIDTDTYRFWADFFSSRGLVAMIYDKRGVGESQGSWKAASIPELAGDAAAAFRYLQSRAEVDASRVGWMGISQGGWVVPAATGAVRDAAFAILDVAPSVSVYEQELQRVKYQMLAEEFGEKEIARALDHTRAVLAAARTGRDVERVRQQAHALRGQPWAQFVDLELAADDLAAWKALDYDPAVALKRFRVPVLVLYGESDTLVPPAENADRMRTYLAAAGNPEVTLAIIPGAQHNMELFGTLRNDKWQWPDSYWSWAHRSIELYRVVDDWLLKRRLFGVLPAPSGARPISP